MTLLLDTSGMLCLIDSSEPQHELAVEYYESAVSRLTHSYVLAELIPLSRSRGRSVKVAIGFSRTVMTDPTIGVVWVDDRLHEAAMSLLESRPDKEYSICDAVSFVMMRDRGIVEALTTDRHFEQEGFVRLLKPGT